MKKYHILDKFTESASSAAESLRRPYCIIFMMYDPLPWPWYRNQLYYMRNPDHGSINPAELSFVLKTS